MLIELLSYYRTPVRTNSFLPSPLTSNPDKSRKSIPTIQPQPGFLGSTSYAAVFTESQTQIGLDADQDNGELQHTHSDPTASSLGKDALIKQGAAVLALLSDFPLYGPFIDQWLDYARGLALIAPFMPECMASIKRDLYDPFVKAQSGRALLHASEMLFTNGAKPMKMDPGMTFRQYHTLFTGENLRWEALGMLFTAVGLSCLIMLAADTTVDSPQTGTFDKRTLAHRMLEASDASIAFCEQTGHLNDPGMWLIYENFLLMSLAIGDSSKSSWSNMKANHSKRFKAIEHGEDSAIYPPQSLHWDCTKRSKSPQMYHSGLQKYASDASPLHTLLTSSWRLSSAVHQG